MTTQYLRKCSIVIADASGTGIDLSDLRCVFTIRRGDFQTPNSCDLRVYNLADGTAHQVCGSEFTQVVIQAGYEGNYGQVFKGTIRQRRLGREDAVNSYVDITAADGDAAYNFATISHSLASATPGTVAAALLSAMQRFGITQGYQPAFSQNGSVRGRVYYGSVKEELRDFANANDCVWSIQDGALTFIPKTAYVAGDAPIISPSSGLIDTPEQTQNGINMRVLLNPSIKIGQAVKLDATVNLYRFGLDVQSQRQNANLAPLNKTNADGLYYVMVAEHQGDTRGTPWYTDLTCLSIDATAPSLDQTNALVATDVPTAIGRN